jgi:hypothetical protein
VSDLLTMSPAKFCNRTKACPDGRKWAITQPTTADMWDHCPFPNWLLWIADKIGRRPDHCTLHLFADWCARNTPLRDGRKTGDLLIDHPSFAVDEVVKRYAHGNATTKELDAAVIAASRAAVRIAVDVAVQDATVAVWDATFAAWNAAEANGRNTAWIDARSDGWAKAGVAAGDACNAARVAAEVAQCNYLRTLVPNPFRKEAKP